MIRATPEMLEAVRREGFTVEMPDPNAPPTRIKAPVGKGQRKTRNGCLKYWAADYLDKAHPELDTLQKFCERFNLNPSSMKTATAMLRKSREMEQQAKRSLNE